MGVIPGQFFYPEEGKGKDTIRFAFAKVNPQDSIEGVRRLREALEGFRENGGAS